MFESKNQQLVSTQQFVVRVANCVAIGLVFIIAALCIGMVGYYWLEGMSWLDAFTNSALTLSDMGLVTPLKTSGGKIFAGIYAMLSGLIFLSVVGVIFAPVIHRFFHKFHLSADMEAKLDK